MMVYRILEADLLCSVEFYRLEVLANNFSCILIESYLIMQTENVRISTLQLWEKIFKNLAFFTFFLANAQSSGFSMLYIAVTLAE